MANKYISDLDHARSTQLFAVLMEFAADTETVINLGVSDRVVGGVIKSAFPRGDIEGVDSWLPAIKAAAKSHTHGELHHIDPMLLLSHAVDNGLRWDLCVVSDMWAGSEEKELLLERMEQVSEVSILVSRFGKGQWLPSDYPQDWSPLVMDRVNGFYIMGRMD